MSGAEGGPGKRAGHKASTAPRSDPYSTAGQSQLTGEAGGNQDVGTHAMVRAALTTYGTGRHCQTARVRQAVMRRRTRGTAV